MPKIHFLNVNEGDCIILEHVSGRITIFDMSAGNIDRQQNAFEEALGKVLGVAARGNYRMCEHPTNPLDYLHRLGAISIWRFILSHPDMDHLDGFDALLNEFDVLHFWNSGAERKKPNFGNHGGFREEDWDRYARVIGGKEPGTKSIVVRAGSRFTFANEDDNNGNGDGLYILTPSKGLIDEGSRTQDFNDASYVVLYHSTIGKVLLAGDAHDATWEYVKEHHKNEVSDVDLLIAPHHGRKSGRSYEFLDYVRPKLTLFGCAPSEYLAYDAWNYRNLAHITNNQCGCIVAEGTKKMDVYIENDTFAAKSGGNINYTNGQGFYFLLTVK